MKETRPINIFQNGMGRTSYKGQQEIVHAASKIEGVVQEKHASSQPQENLDIATTLDQTVLPAPCGFTTRFSLAHSPHNLFSEN
ncbi:hypothetical protein OS493_029716 [Desmophyllum pertusum]|uniref:Uncharacterized protein n=1 Tax=Desmophyllum pertusum TaxID=174260 RepID=A0A9W9Z962_9CNID|nr:hypothetical protein OS493_029716 [Desmophyllum pertusum]